MTAEKIITSNALASISRAKSHETQAKPANSADVFSRHLDQKLDNVEKNSAPIDQKDRSDKHRQNDLNANKINDEKQRSSARQDAQLDKKRQADKQAEKLKTEKQEAEKRADEANDKNEDSIENTKIFSGETQSLNEQTTKTNETISLDANENTTISENAIDDSETDTQTSLQSVETQNNNEISQILAETSGEEESASTEIAATLLAASETSLNKTNADEKGFVTNSGALSSQQDGQSLTVKTGQPIDAANAKTPTHLQSTLGQDNDGQGGGNGEGQKGQSSENQTQFNKPKSDLFAPKEGTFSQNNPLQTNNAPILSSTQLADQFTKGQNLKAPGSEIRSAEMTQLISNDKAGDTSTSIGTNADVKNSTPATQLRAAGYTSPTQSLAIQIAAKAQNGAQQFEIRLNPPELGRVDVRLEFTKDGQVTTHLIVERPETLDMLSKDARQLEKALSEAGVDIENEGLTFSLQDQESQGSASQEKNETFSNKNQLENEETATQIEPETIYRQLSATSGLDMSV